MKILCTAEPHGDIEMLRRAGKFGLEQRVDLWLANGDFINNPWNHEQFEEYCNLVRELIKLCEERNFCGSIEKLVQQIENNPNEKVSIKEIAKTYLRFSEIAKERILEEYEKFAEIFDEIEIPSMVLPGNHDSNQLMKHIFEFTLHKEKKEIEINKEAITIAGYGGANLYPIYLPQRLVTPFHEYFYLEEKTFRSEPLNFFLKEKPDIVMTHMPPKGILDYVLHGRAKFNTDEYLAGSIGLRIYLDISHKEQIQPVLWLCAHMHEEINVGAKKYGQTVILNPGAIGKFDTNYGTFMIIDLQNKKFEKATLYLISSEEIIPIKEYFETERGFNTLELSF